MPTEGARMLGAARAAYAEAVAPRRAAREAAKRAAAAKQAERARGQLPRPACCGRCAQSCQSKKGSLKFGKNSLATKQ